MKVVIAGGYSSFLSKLVDRLGREGCEVFTITGKLHSAGAEFSTEQHINYNFDTSDESVRLIMSSIVPDAIIFMGATDCNYTWDIPQRDSMNYLSALSNMLIIADDLRIKNFIYISSHEVYGTKHLKAINEDAEKNPEDVRSLVISQGEDLCLGFNKTRDMKTTVLRISNLYGAIDSGKKDDFAAAMCKQAIKTGLVESPERLIISPTYITDAIDAVYKVVSAPNHRHSVYNVSGDTVTGDEIAGVVRRLAEIRDDPDYGIKSEGDEDQFELPEVSGDDVLVQLKSDEESAEERSRRLNIAVDSSRFKLEFRHRCLVGFEKGMRYVYRSLRRNFQAEQQKEIKASNENKIFPKIVKIVRKILVSFLENIFAFVLFFVLSYICSNVKYLQDIDFMLFYVVIIAVTFGVQQASLAVLGACFYYIWNAMRQSGMQFFDVIVDYQTVIRVLSLFAIAVIVGYMRDKLRQQIAERDDIIELTQKELEDIYAINESNTKIKNVLDERLTNYDDSLAKIYSIVSKLNTLEPEKILFEAVGVIQTIMRSNDLCIYNVSKNNAKICRLVATSPGSMRALKKTIRLYELGPLADSMAQNEIYVNRDFDPDLPLMAAPVLSNGELVSILLLWSVNFENITIYHVNLFAILCKLISSSIEKAYLYTDGMQSFRYIEGTCVLNSEDFKDVANIFLEAKEKDNAECSLFEVDLNGSSLGYQGAKLRAHLRVSDYIGTDDRGRLLMLLSSTDIAESKYVLQRLAKDGIEVRETKLFD